MERERAVVHVVEPEHMFVSVLIALFRDAGLSIDHIARRPDPRALVEDQPDIVFLDTDHLDDPFAAVRLVQSLVPNAQILVFVGSGEPEIRREFLFTGATSVLEKNAERGSIVSGLRLAAYRRRLSPMPGPAPA